MDKAYVDFHRARVKEMTLNFSAKDIYNLDYDSLRFNKDTHQYECYGYMIKKFNKDEYYIVDVEDKYELVTSCYKALFHSIEEVNGFIHALYKVYHKQIEPR